MLEVVPGRIDVAQQLAFDATIPVRNDQVEQFGHFEVFGGRVVQERSFREAIVDVAEKRRIELQPGIVAWFRVRQSSHWWLLVIFSL